MPRLVAALVLAVMAGAACGRGEDAAPLGPAEGIVTKVVDGDTLNVRMAVGDEKVRLIGIDTPETHGRGGLRECFGTEATAYLGELAPAGTRVRLTRDAELRDRYGRLLAYVYRQRDALFLNAAMARDGFADILTLPPNVAHADELLAAVQDARAAQRGLWRACGSADVPL